MERKLYIAQRASAMLLTPLVLIHLGLILIAVEGGLSGAEILNRTQGNPYWAIFYSVFVISAAVHAPIGLRNIMNEWTQFSRCFNDVFCVLFALVSGFVGFYAVLSVTFTTS